MRNGRRRHRESDPDIHSLRSLLRDDSLVARPPTLINLFNLIPVWQLDGSRGFHALSRVQRGIVVAAIAITFALTGQKLLIIVGAVAIWRTFQSAVTLGDRRTLATFIVLIAVLSWLSKVHSV